jgi:hypothetical protein
MLIAAVSAILVNAAVAPQPPPLPLLLRVPFSSLVQILGYVLGILLL